jgi:enamine deaminase RidA (YjgF/YER057c/UK114 family)
VADGASKRQVMIRSNRIMTWFLIPHDLFGKPVSTFPDHALSSGHTNQESSMTIQRFETGPRMSQVVVHGNTVYLAGVVAHKAAGESVTKQTQEVLSIIDSHLATAGSDKSKLLTATIYLTDMKNFAEMNAVWDGWVSAGNTPARATVEAKLAAPQYGVEIMVIAAK